MASLNRGALPAVLHRSIPFLLAALIALLMSATPFGERLELSFSDWRLRNFPPASAAPPITVVTIDETALDLLGPWPWPRSLMAEFIDRLFSRYAPAAVGLDMVFPPGMPEVEDAALARALAGRPVAVGQLFTEEAGARGVPHYQTIDNATGLPRFAGTLANSAGLGDPPTGHINALIDTDGKMRRIWPAACTPDGCALALSAQLLGLLTGARHWRIEAGAPWQSPWRLVPENLDELALPLDERHAAIIPWRASPPHRYVSAAQIWQGTIAPELLQNHLVLVGATAHSLGDRVNTPVGTNIPGVETHARVLGEWLDARLPSPLAGGRVVLLVAWLLQTIILLRLRRRGGVLAAAAIALSLAALAANLAAYRFASRQLPLAEPVVYPLVFGAGLMLAAWYADRRWIMGQIVSYLPTPLARHLRDHTPELAEETCWSTVMYADVIGSTTASRHMSAVDLAHWSNRGVDLVAQEVTQRGGIIDNIAGDGLMVYWRDGSPAEQARRALDAAQAIRRGLVQLNADQQADWPPLRMGLGVHAGTLLAGSFGQARRRYTILGEVANLAFRIERQTRTLPSRQLFSAAVAEHADGFSLRPLADVVLEGSDEPIKLFAFAEDATD